MNIQKLNNPLRQFINSLKCNRHTNIYRSYNAQSANNTDGPAKATQKLFEGLLRGDRACLARSITLIESSHPVKSLEARKLISLANAHAKKTNLESKTFRIGLSGPPGAGKSTFIEAMGMKLTANGHKVAVLAVDPSSGNKGGSLLGDKTRMPELTRDPNAYIRPSPNNCHLGGVTRNTNDTILLCEVCGYDTIIVETVGVGQSEYAVVDMVDAFCLLLPPTAGDELQGIKRGIVEMSDIILINKSDGDLLSSARRTASDYTSALKFMRPRYKTWKPRVYLISSKLGTGLDEAWERMIMFKNTMQENGDFHTQRSNQRKKWMWNYIHTKLLDVFNQHYTVREKCDHLENLVVNQKISPGEASDVLISDFIKSYKLQE